MADLGSRRANPQLCRATASVPLAQARAGVSLDASEPRLGQLQAVELPRLA